MKVGESYNSLYETSTWLGEASIQILSKWLHFNNFVLCILCSMDDDVEVFKKHYYPPKSVNEETPPYFLVLLFSGAAGSSGHYEAIGYNAVVENLLKIDAEYPREAIEGVTWSEHLVEESKIYYNEFFQCIACVESDSEIKDCEIPLYQPDVSFFNAGFVADVLSSPAVGASVAFAEPPAVASAATAVTVSSLVIATTKCNDLHSRARNVLRNTLGLPESSTYSFETIFGNPKQQQQVYYDEATDKFVINYSDGREDHGSGSEEHDGIQDDGPMIATFDREKGSTMSFIQKAMAYNLAIQLSDETQIRTDVHWVCDLLVGTLLFRYLIIFC